MTQTRKLTLVFNRTIDVEPTAWGELENGYPVVRGCKFYRSGTFEFLRGEVGLTLPDQPIIGFLSDKTLQGLAPTFELVPFTMDHPDIPESETRSDVDNTKSIGVVMNVRFIPPDESGIAYLVGDFVFHSKTAAKLARPGPNGEPAVMGEVSTGLYTIDKFVKGVFNGQSYEFEMTQNPNGLGGRHVALVEKGRAGPECRILNSKKGSITMAIIDRLKGKAKGNAESTKAGVDMAMPAIKMFSGAKLDQIMRMTERASKYPKILDASRLVNSTRAIVGVPPIAFKFNKETDWNKALMEMPFKDARAIMAAVDNLRNSEKVENDDPAENADLAGNAEGENDDGGDETDNSDGDDDGDDDGDKKTDNSDGDGSTNGDDDDDGGGDDKTKNSDGDEPESKGENKANSTTRAKVNSASVKLNAKIENLQKTNKALNDRLAAIEASLDPTKVKKNTMRINSLHQRAAAVFGTVGIDSFDTLEAAVKKINQVSGKKFRDADAIESYLDGIEDSAKSTTEVFKVNSAAGNVADYYEKGYK